MNKNKVRKFAFLWLQISLITAIIFPFGSVSAAAENKPESEFRPGEILVKLKANDNLYKVKVEPGESLAAALKRYKENPKVEYAEPNSLYHESILAPNDPFYFEQNYLKRIEIARAWDQSTGSSDIVIAVLDSGVDIDHEDLKENIWHNTKEIEGDKIDNDKNGYIDDMLGWDFVAGNNDPRPKFTQGCVEKKTCSKGGVNHGTIIAGLLAARGNNGLGITGVAWQSKIMPLRVLASDGSGDAYSVSRAIDYAVKNGASIINLSFVGFDYSRAMSDAIRRAYDKGVIVVAAAGNENNPDKTIDLDKEKIYPICYAGPKGENWVIGVASLDNEKRKSFFSNYGKDCIDISAPGSGFYSTQVYNTADPDFIYPYGGYWSGTSLSVPLVSGVIALIKSKNKNLTSTEVVNNLLNGADEIDSVNLDYMGKLGRGLLDASRALSSVAGGVETKVTPLRLASLVVGPSSSSSAVINQIDSINKLIRQQFPAYDAKFRGGVSLATGDVDGDGQEEIITGALAGGGPQVKVFDRQGGLKRQFFAYDKNFLGGVNVATVDLNSDGIKEIATAPASAGGPQIKVWDGNGNLRLQFFAFDRAFKGGVNIAGGDVDNDGREEIIAAPARNNYPFIRLFDNNGTMKEQFFAFNKSFRGGVNIATADLNGDGLKVILAAPASGGGPQVKILDGIGQVRQQFFAFDSASRTGVNLAAGDVDNDGVEEIVVASGQGGSPHVKIFNKKGELKNQFYAYNRDFLGGVKIAVIK